MIDFGALREIITSNPPYEWVVYALMYYTGDVPPEVVVEYVKRICGYVPMYMWYGENGPSFRIVEAYTPWSNQIMGYANVGGYAVVIGWWGDIEQRMQRAIHELVRLPMVSKYWRPWAAACNCDYITPMINECLDITDEWINSGAIPGTYIFCELEEMKKHIWTESRSLLSSQQWSNGAQSRDLRIRAWEAATSVSREPFALATTAYARAKAYGRPTLLDRERAKESALSAINARVGEDITMGVNQ